VDRPTWLTAFLDLPADGFAQAVAFWRQVTGYGLSEPRGDDGEFATLVPPQGDAFLRVQRVGSEAGGVHLDLHAPGHPFEVRRSPGGLPYCLVDGSESVRPEPATWPDGNRSWVDQVCIDIPPELYDAECAFWAERIGWELVDLPDDPEFRRLRKPDGQLLNILLQRLDSPGGAVRAHLDLSSDDRSSEVRRHEELGASVLRVHDGWTVMQPPAGPVYCITGRKPPGDQT